MAFLWVSDIYNWAGFLCYRQSHYKDKLVILSNCDMDQLMVLRMQHITIATEQDVEILVIKTDPQNKQNSKS